MFNNLKNKNDQCRVTKGFHAMVYADRYPDLKKVFGYDTIKLKNHFFQYGEKEGRSASIEQPLDIKVIEQYTFINCDNGAIKEILKSLNYTSDNSNLKIIGEGLITFISIKTDELFDIIKMLIDQKKKSFNAIVYADRYPDLKKMFGYDAIKLKNHFFQYGEKEGRSASIEQPLVLLIDKNSLILVENKIDYLKYFEHILIENRDDYESMSNKYLNYNYILLSDLSENKILKKSIIKLSDENYNKNRNKYKKLRDIIHPYAIYFPQFHSIAENNKNFYNGYTDILGLIEVEKQNNEIIYETPNYELINSSNLLDYNYVKNVSIIDRQIKIARNYGYCGFCMYYYWFSNNLISEDNMLFQKAVNLFFTKKLSNFKIFFNWANEEWCEELTNIYSIENIENNIKNLVPYFKHENYLKINNKPVFLLHCPFYLTMQQLTIIESVFTKKLKENGFSGIHLTLDNIANKTGYSNFNQFSHQPYHHKNKNIGGHIEKQGDEFYLDFETYTNYIANTDTLDNDIKTIFLNFDNSARKIFHKSIDSKIEIWKTKNNSFSGLQKYIKTHLKYYKKERSQLNKIFLVNSWNEWGEGMAIEPSNETNMFYLELINKCLINILKI
jgi:hypothetical protein